MKVRIYTDGGCSGNPGPGAWAYIILQPDSPDDPGNPPAEIRRAGFAARTTNNRMELQAVIEALQAVKGNPLAASAAIDLFTDSQYVKNGITSWIHTWMRNGWRTAAKQPVKNQQLWKQLHALSSELRIRWHWLQGHAGDRYNEACDLLVRQTMRRG